MKATTGREGSAASRPNASGSAQPIVQSPEDCSSPRGIGVRHICDSRIRWAPESAVATVSSGSTRRHSSTTAAGPHASSVGKAVASAARVAMGSPPGQVSRGAWPSESRSSVAPTWPTTFILAWCMA